MDDHKHELTIPCPTCGKAMIARYTGEIRPDEHGKPLMYVHRWYCGEHGDQHELLLSKETMERQTYQRWQDVQGK
jgi:hypothetical protein